MVTVTAHDASVEVRTHAPERVVEETGVVVRVVRHYPLTADGRRLTTIEDEHGTIRDLGAGGITENTLLDIIISGALRKTRASSLGESLVAGPADQQRGAVGTR